MGAFQDSREQAEITTECRTTSNLQSGQDARQRLSALGLPDGEADAIAARFDDDPGFQPNVRGVAWAMCMEQQAGYECVPAAGDVDNPPERCLAPPMQGGVGMYWINPHTTQVDELPEGEPGAAPDTPAES